ncbi:MAG TPA: hypothetical protein VMI75_24965 [Polyangiaceae bacterium]|nr:hypothetical protein [Polyangiaceae bacterium]
MLASQIVLVAMLLQVTGRSAIAFSFLGAPMLGVAVLLLALSWWRSREGSHAKMDRDPGRGDSRGGRT